MVDKNRSPKYTYLKDGIYYFSRLVPHDLKDHYSKPRIVQSLRTSSSVYAKRAATVLSAKLDDYWLGLRLNRQDVPASHLLVKAKEAKSSDLPNIEEALEIYFSVIGKGRQKLFFTTARRYVGYLIQCLGIRPIDEYSSKDATILREWLVNKGLSKSSLRRAFSSIKAVINFVILEHGLTCQNPFTKVYLPNNDDAKKRHAITEANRLKIQRHCLKTDDDIRWLVSLIMDSGMRLSEAAGLMNSDIYLDDEIPHITVKTHPHRRLKTASSQRKIPLIGMSLWAVNRLKSHSTGAYCFPRYASENRCHANSASAALNKWIKTVGGKDDVIHGLRHSFRDRLRAVEAPTDLIDQLGGWSMRTVGQGYGDGYSLDILMKYMKKLEQ